MTTMLGGTQRRLIVSNERIACPLRGDRDVENCLSCSYLTALDLEAPSPWVSCHVPKALSPIDLFSLYVKE